jgi:hypothetical protein
MMAPGAGRELPGGVLEHTLATPFAVGTNLRGRVTGAAWTFLLPTLELATVLCLGLPGEATLLTLCRLADRVVVVPGKGEHAGAVQGVARLGRREVELLSAADDRLDGVIADLAVVTGARPSLPRPVQEALLARAAVVFADADAGADPGSAARQDAAATGDTGLWLAPRSGEVRQAAALGDARTVAFLRGSGPGRGGRTPLRRAVRRLVLRTPRGERAGSLSTLCGGAPPAYVREIAAAAGADLSGCTVGLSAPSEYASRKAILFLFDGPAATAPRWVVKLTREGHLNARLENEWAALACLRDAGIGDAATLPRPAFAGEHAGLAVVGETGVEGAPLRARTSATADCPLAGAGLRWLLDLGERSAAPSAGAGDVAAALGDLRDRFDAIYDLAPAERRALDGLLDRIAAAGPIPLVFQHGDPGTWNVLVTDDGRPVFLDWEAFERRGMPLWDALYFARSHAVTVGRAAGARDAMQAIHRGWLQDGPLMQDLASAVAAHCAAIGLPRDLVEPLFVTCWMHRALKEAGRLAPGRLQRGHYAALLRLALEQRDAPGLQRLYGVR